MKEKNKLKEYFEFADTQGLLFNGVKFLTPTDIENINRKRTDLFGSDWEY